MSLDEAKEIRAAWANWDAQFLEKCPRHLPASKGFKAWYISRNGAGDGPFWCANKCETLDNFLERLADSVSHYVDEVVRPQDDRC